MDFGTSNSQPSTRCVPALRAWESTRYAERRVKAEVGRVRELDRCADGLKPPRSGGLLSCLQGRFKSAVALDRTSFRFGQRDQLALADSRSPQPAQRLEAPFYRRADLKANAN